MKTLPQRKSPRLKGYDYSQSGAYFVTICTHQRVHLFGEVIESDVVLNRAGEIVAERWFALPDHHLGIELDAFVVMPNHVHGIIVLVGTTPALSALDGTNADDAGIVPTVLGTVVGSYKSGVTRRIREALNEPELRLWQTRYHDHIIQNESELHRFREYVVANPSKWGDDIFY